MIKKCIICGIPVDTKNDSYLEFPETDQLVCNHDQAVLTDAMERIQLANRQGVLASPEMLAAMQQLSAWLDAGWFIP